MKQYVLIALAALPTVPAIAQEQRSPNTADIVVTGQSVDGSAAALADCLKRGCPVVQDVQATLAHADNLFMVGKYAQARTTLMASIRRNKRFAKHYPVAVAGLYRANSRVAINLGEASSYRMSNFAALDALRAGLPADDARVLAQRIEVADIFVKTGLIEQALAGYRQVANDARRIGNKSMEGTARFRRAMLCASIVELHPEYESDARKAADWLIAQTDPEFAPFKTAAQLINARLRARKGDSHEMDELIAHFGRTPRPLLVYSPPLLDPGAQRAMADGSVTNQLGTANVNDQWIDVGFWVKPDGSVADIDLLRQSPKVDKVWVKPVVEMVSKRRYAPLALADGDPGLLRVERYTRTAYWTKVTGSRLREREPMPRIEMIDLTAEPPVTPPPVAPKT